jgi:Trk K+ transport system NAD-binding subunit
MKIIIVGGGRTGYHLAKYIPRSVIVEKNPEKFEKLKELIGINVVLGDASDEDVLLKAGIQDADMIIIVTADDKTNYEVASIAKKYGVKNIVARMENPDNEEKFEKLNISATLCPTTMVANYIRLLIHPEVTKEFFIKKILVPIISPQTMEEAFEEALQISVRTDAELTLIGNKKEHLGEEKKILRLLDVPASLEIEEGDMVAAIEKHMEGADLVVIDSEELSYFEKMLKKSIIIKLLENFSTPILVSRVFRPYSKILYLADSSEAILVASEMSRLFGEIFASTVEILKLDDSPELKEALEDLKEYGKKNGFHVEEIEFEGNVNIEAIKKVRSKEYELTILPWGDTTALKNDVISSMIREAPGSVLIVKG